MFIHRSHRRGNIGCIGELFAVIVGISIVGLFFWLVNR